MSELGFIGTGAMGCPMACRLLDAGHQVYVYDIVGANVATLRAAGAVACESAAQVARKARVVFLMVGTAAEVEEVLFESGAAAEQLGEGQLVVCMSTIEAAVARRIAQRLGQRNVGFLDAPVSGGTTGARDGSLTIMVGGNKADYDAALPLFKLMGGNINLIGSHGYGQTAKAANQIIVVLTRAAVGEALLFAQRDGADPETVRRALLGGYAQSHTLEHYALRLRGRDNPVEFGSAILKKDLNGIVEAADELGIKLPFTRLVQQMYNAS